MEAFDLFPRGDAAGQRNAAAERTVDATAAYFGARTVVALGRDREGLAPVAVRGADRAVLSAIVHTVTTHRGELDGGLALSGSADEIDPSSQGSFVLAPVLEADQLVAVLFVGTDGPRLRDPKDLNALVQFCRMLGAAIQGPLVALGGLKEFLEQTPSDEVARQQLLALLERHEWNIARVARAMGTTRSTIYKRLERYGAERLRVPKTNRRRRLA
jgi:hypothetical protein